MALATEPLVRRRRFTVDEYHRMGEAGILCRPERVELIEGEIVQMAPMGPPHMSVVARIAKAFASSLGDRAIVWTQGPVVLRALGSEPEPDVTLLRPKEDFYRSGHPEPRDVLLIMEVMDSSAAYDRRVKAPLYARAGIAEVWLVDVTTSTVEVHRGPSAEGYAERRMVGRDDALAPLAFPDLPLRGRDLTG